MQKGLFSTTIKVSDSSGRTGQVSIEIIVFEAGRGLLVVPDAGTTAGGTEVRVYSYAETFQQDSSVTFGVTSGSGSPVGSAPAESKQYISGHFIKAVTPRLPEGYANVSVSTPWQGIVTCPSCYRYTTLAFTANQVSQDLSVVDTAMLAPFDADPTIPGVNSLAFDEPIVPMGMAFTKGNKPGRAMLIVDYYSGNMKIADAANFAISGEVLLQEPSVGHTDPGAFDVAISEDGLYAYVAHMTPGTYHPLLPPPYVWNPTGSISVVRLLADQQHGAFLIDVDGNPATTTPGAPTGITRIEPPLDWKFVPLSIEDVAVFKPTWMYQAGDKWPGEYLFLSGVGPSEWDWIIPIECIPMFKCDPIHIISPRPIEVAVVDLNPQRVMGTTIINGKPVPQLGPNPTYRQFIKKIPIGSGGEFPSDQGLSFYVFQENRDMNAYVYAVNPAQYRTAILDFNTLDVLKDASGDPILIPTGSAPSDVKVQRVEIAPGIFETYVYIVDALGEELVIANAASNALVDKIAFDSCVDKDHYPTAFDTRSSGDKGFSADFHGESVTVFDLVHSSLWPGPQCNIKVGQYPARIAVQPVVTLEDTGGPIHQAISYADPVADFTEPAKQPVLVNDWEQVQELEETHASPQAVLSNLDNFQKNANKWIKGDALKVKLNESVDLYRLIYKAENWENLPPGDR